MGQNEIQIMIWSLITFLITVIITSLLWYLYIKAVEQSILNQLIGQSQQDCAAPIIYREEVYIPFQNGVYEKNLAIALVDITNAISSANCTNILPIPNPPGFNQQLRVEGIDPISGQLIPLSYIFWNESSNRAVISFIGTEMKSEWQSDFQYQQVAPTILNGYQNGILVHKGFYNIYLAARDKLWNWWNQNMFWVDTLYIIGHSLGGALSTICAFDFADALLNKEPQITLDMQYPLQTTGTTGDTIKLPIHYSFGAPRSGNPKYAEIFNQRMPASIRVNNTEDIVPQLPLATFNSYTYEQTGGNIPFTESLGSIADDHIEAYMNYLPICAQVAQCHVDK